MEKEDLTEFQNTKDLQGQIKKVLQSSLQHFLKSNQ